MQQQQKQTNKQTNKNKSWDKMTWNVIEHHVLFEVQ